MIAPGVMIGQILGRWGNFFNGEAFGRAPAEGSVLYRFRMEVKQENWFYSVTAHPTFFYESLWNLIGFLIINALYKKKRFDGEVFLWYITWYGFGRMFIEGLRTDSLYGFGGLRVSQLVGAACFIAGLALTVIFRVRAVRAGTRPVYTGAAAPTENNMSDAPASSYSALIDSEKDTSEKKDDNESVNNENKDKN